jgi:ribosome-binding factor A
MDKTRIEKIERLMQKDMSLILQQNAQELLSSAIISVTKVRVSSDLSIAKFYVSIFPVNNLKKEVVLKMLGEKTSFLRKLLGEKERFQLRVIPQITFFIDDSLDYIEKIDTLLKQ